MVDVHTSEVDANIAPVNVESWYFVYCMVSDDEQLVIRQFCEN